MSIKDQLKAQFTLSRHQEEEVDAADLCMALAVLQLKEAYRVAEGFKIVKEMPDENPIMAVVDQILGLMKQ